MYSLSKCKKLPFSKQVQERALRFINNDFTSSLPDLLKQTNTQPLHVRRMKLMACEVYKIVNDLSPKYINDMVNIKNSSYNFRSEKKAEGRGTTGQLNKVWSEVV